MITLRSFLKLFINLITGIVLLTATVEAAVESTSNPSQRFKHLYEYALISNAVYQDSAEVAKLLNSHGYVLTASGELPGYGVAYILATNDKLKQQILAVRGTSNIENALVDVAHKLLPNKQLGINLHQGFALSAGMIYEKIKAGLIKEYSINITGHSLGGAAAVILAMYIDSSGLSVGKVITFGQPKVTNISGSQQYSHLDITRVVMPKDVVPLVPPLDAMNVMNMDVDIYWHLGTEVILQSANTYSELKGFDSMMRATDFLNEAISEKNLQQHSMALYLKLLEKLQTNPQRVPYKNDFNIMDLFGGASPK